MTAKSKQVSIRNFMPSRGVVLTECILLVTSGITGFLGYRLASDIELAIALVIAVVVATVVLRDARKILRDFRDVRRDVTR